MHIERHNIYGNIHKALRAFMFDTLQRLGTLDVNDEADMHHSCGQLDALLRQMAGHLKHENDFLHPALEARRHRSASRTADDHHSHEDGIEQLGAELDALRAAAPVQRPPLAERLYRHLALFIAENLQHMHVEETDNNAVLWECYSDAELEDIHDQLLATVQPAVMTDALAWMINALNPRELAGLFCSLRHKLPAQAFDGVMGMARERLGDTRWLRLNSALAHA